MLPRCSFLRGSGGARDAASEPPAFRRDRARDPGQRSGLAATARLAGRGEPSSRLRGALPRLPGLDPEQLVVRREGPDEIFWESRNPCPTLAACESLGLDTRSRLSPGLRQARAGFLSSSTLACVSCATTTTCYSTSRFAPKGIVRLRSRGPYGLGDRGGQRPPCRREQGYGAVARAPAERPLARAHDIARHARPSFYAESMLFARRRGSARRVTLLGTAAVDLLSPAPCAHCLCCMGESSGALPTALRSPRQLASGKRRHHGGRRVDRCRGRRRARGHPGVPEEALFDLYR